MKRKNGYWTKERLQEEVLKYKTRGEFRAGCSWGYRIALKNKWMNDLCTHMIVIGNLMRRCIYAYEFTDNHVYVGLTHDINERHDLGHLVSEKSAVFQHILKNTGYTLQKLTDYVDVNDAKLLENDFLDRYKRGGWIILNKIKTGGVGGGLKWTIEKCHEEALKYKSRKEFQLNSPAYYRANRNNWLDIICGHMIPTKDPNGFWTQEKCQEVANEYQTRKEFHHHNVKVYNVCVRNKWLDDVCETMINNGYKTKKYEH